MTYRSRFLALFVGATLALGSSSVIYSQEDGGDDGDVTEPCGAECWEAGAAARDACREDGGNFFECFRAYSDAFRACREEAGCDDGWSWPGRDDDDGERPEICGIECFSSARDASAACREDGGSFWECLGVYRDAVRACREEAGCEVREIPERPEICGAECFETGRDAFRACRDEDGGFFECARAFLEAVGTCREEAGCNPADEEEQEEEDEAVEELLASAVEFTRGDVNDDAETNISDAVNLLTHLFLEGPAPQCMDAADANDDGVVDISDPTTILNSLFIGTRPIPAPSVEPGIDPTPDALNCGVL